MLQGNEHCKKERERSKQVTNAAFFSNQKKLLVMLPNSNLFTSLKYNKIIFELKLKQS